MLDSLGDSLNLLHLSLLNQRVLTLYLVSVQVYQSLNDHSQPQQLLLIWIRLTSTIAIACMQQDCL